MKPLPCERYILFPDQSMIWSPLHAPFFLSRQKKKSLKKLPEEKFSFGPVHNHRGIAEAAFNCFVFSFNLPPIFLLKNVCLRILKLLVWLSINLLLRAHRATDYMRLSGEKVFCILKANPLLHFPISCRQTAEQLFLFPPGFFIFIRVDVVWQGGGVVVLPRTDNWTDDIAE